MQGRLWSVDELDRITKLFALGESDESIAAKVGRSAQAVNKQLRGRGLFRIPFKLPRRKHIATDNDEVETARQRKIRDDQRFQEAMYAAGYQPRTVVTPSTERPRRLALE